MTEGARQSWRNQVQVRRRQTTETTSEDRTDLRASKMLNSMP
jgi:hypothetical protein